MNLYSTLGVNSDATAAQIRAAYRRRAQKCHPDKNNGQQTEEFQALRDAYDVLRNAERRERYDRTGRSDKEPDMDAQAISEICKGLDQILEMNQFANMDYIGHMRTGIKQAMLEGQKNIGKLVNQEGKIDRLMGSVVGALPHSVLTQKKQHTISQREQIAANLEIMGRMMEILEDLKCGDRQLPVSQPIYTTSNISYQAYHPPQGTF